MQASLELAVVGNCSWGGLIDGRERLVWACLPRFDSDPVFPSLLDAAPDHDGTFSIERIDFDSSEQRYDGRELAASADGNLAATSCGGTSRRPTRCSG